MPANQEQTITLGKTGVTLMSSTQRIYRLSTMAACLTALMACDTIGNPFQVLGQRAPAPDEFQVVSRKPLVMPSSVGLPEPRLGERSPLDPNPERDAIAALLGADAVSPVPSASDGEQALLAAANASSSDGEIRQIIEAEEASVDPNEAYEAPSIFELFESDTKQPVKDALNPAAEARRLQTEGIAAAPIDPDDRPASEVEAQSAEPRDLYYQTDDGKPQNRLPTVNTKPAFE